MKSYWNIFLKKKVIEILKSNHEEKIHHSGFSPFHNFFIQLET